MTDITIPVADTYGGVIINSRGEVLLREPSGHFGGYVWTFPKGRPEPGETPEETALREVFEETGQRAVIWAAIARVFDGTTSSTAFFLMSPEGVAHGFSSETAAVCWVTESDAVEHLRQSSCSVGRARDLAVLKAGFDMWRAWR